MSPKQRYASTRFKRTCIVLALLAAPSGTAQPDPGLNAGPATRPATGTTTDSKKAAAQPASADSTGAAPQSYGGTTPRAASADAAMPPPPMAPFALLVDGAWQTMLPYGVIRWHSWHWGPGKFSIRKETDGEDVAGPGSGEGVWYWHPGRKQVCALGWHGDIPGIGCGVSVGTVRFDGQVAEGVFDLYQPGVHRKMGMRWVFNGPDRYRDNLLEDNGAGLQMLNGWDFERIEMRPGPPLRRPNDMMRGRASKLFKAFEPIFEHGWPRIPGAEYEGGFAGDVNFQTTFEWIPTLEVLYARTTATTTDAPPAHVLDTFIYQHVKTDALHCLALSSNGGVYEGTVSMLDGGTNAGAARAPLQIELTGYEEERTVPYLVRFDFELDGTLRHRIWSGADDERKLMYETNHKKVK